jgi:excisionase family DNA binding protein
MGNMANMANRFVLPAEAARLLGVTPRRVTQLVDEGRLAAHRIGSRGVRLIERQAVEALIEQRRQGTARSEP